MKSKAIPHMILAVVLALVAGGLTIRWLSSARQPADSAKTKAVVKKVEVAVAARAIPKGARIDASMVRLKPYDPEAVPLGAIRDMAETVDRVTARDISQDDPITPDKLLAKGATSAGLDTAVMAGKRALTVKGTKVLGAGGLITPGSRVDVVATFQLPGSGEKKMGKLILEDIPVLTTGTEMESRVGKDGREELANTDLYTLMVTPEQAERLALASDQGTLHFALRRVGDAATETTPGADLNSLAGGNAAAATAPPGAQQAEQPAPPPTYVYFSVRGSAPRAVAPTATGGKGDDQSGGQSGAPAGGTPGASPGTPPAGEQASPMGDGHGSKLLDQGTSQIKIHEVTIDLAPAQPQKTEERGKP